MIYINITDERPPPEWCSKADQLTTELKQKATDEERKDFINHNKTVWAEFELVDWLRRRSHGKCWYSESRDIFSFIDVDHFRPKNKVKRVTGTIEPIGYWWLAFDWRNYRLCGNVGNRRKGIKFPLKEGSPVACSPEHDLNDELHYLLDPTDPNDPPLLTFDISGFPRPAVTEGTWEFERVTKTIKILRLDYERLVDARIMIWNICKRKIDQIYNEMQYENGCISVGAKNRIKDLQKELRNMASPSSELSATAKACLLNSEHIWARNLASNL
ncbi:MAG: hypothetical protein WA130_09720 [Candidatus Methanoperedens sp.]